jgi:hypothetical protein
METEPSETQMRQRGPRRGLRHGQSTSLLIVIEVFCPIPSTSHFPTFIITFVHPCAMNFVGFSHTLAWWNIHLSFA